MEDKKINKHTTTLSILVTGVLAYLLINPMEEPVQKPKKNTTQNQIKQAPEPTPPSVVMATVTLPPPPALEPAPVKSIAPLVAAPAKPTPASTKQIEPMSATLELKSAPKPAPIPITPIALTPLKSIAKQPRPIATPVLVKLAPKPTQKQIKPQEKTPVRKSTAQPKSTTETKKQGRPLLKLLEFGKGPSIEITWPSKTSERARLYDLFCQCYGMRVALMNDAGLLFDDQSPRGQAWGLNTDRFSGFVRQSQGRATRAETSDINSIRSHHGFRTGNTVRLFPRETDALLLGGLQNLIGDSYLNSKTIRAAYQVSGWRVRISDIYAGNNPIIGTIDLSGAVKTRCKI